MTMFIIHYSGAYLSFVCCVNVFKKSQDIGLTAVAMQRNMKLEITELVFIDRGATVMNEVIRTDANSFSCWVITASPLQP